MSAITTHALDTARGAPAAGLPIVLERAKGDGWEIIGSGVTNDDGRLPGLTAPGSVQATTYRITFDTDAYFERLGVEGFYPTARIVFRVRDPDSHHHVPLLLSPFGYSTYRGS